MSTLNVSNITDGTTTVGTSYVVNGSAKAWVNFNGTGTIATRDSLNVSSLTDDGVGQYSFTLTNAMSDTTPNYAAQLTPQYGGYMGGFNQGSSTASLVKVTAVTNAGNFSDSNVMACSTLGDLA